jgi:hypothetical protein
LPRKLLAWELAAPASISAAVARKRGRCDFRERYIMKTPKIA